jgi:hypothetical protein
MTAKELSRKTFDSKDADGLKQIAHSLIANPE